MIKNNSPQQAIAFALNADLGEGLDAIDSALFPLLDQANIACTGHAGDAQSMRHCVQLARRFKVTIGAHPSYPDRVNFGRKSLAISTQELSDSLQQQISALISIAGNEGVKVRYIKPHGALYNDWVQPERLTQLVETARHFALPLMLAAGHETIASACAQAGVSYWQEAFVDRGYNADGTLVARSQPQALLDQEQILTRIKALKTGLGIETIAGTRLLTPIDSLCLHSDTPNAVQTARAIRALLASD